MKYELKRQINVNMICYCAPLVIGLIALLLGELFTFAVCFLITACFMINELRYLGVPEMTFDESGFQILDKVYRYEDIDKVDSFRMKYVVWVSITVQGGVVYKFDNGYRNYKEFVKQLTLHNVEHDLFL